MADADIVIAHNANFDRPFCERLARGFESKPWACSVKEVSWAEFGYEGSKLGYLVGQSGWFHTGTAPRTTATRCWKCWPRRCRTIRARH